MWTYSRVCVRAYLPSARTPARTLACTHALTHARICTQNKHWLRFPLHQGMLTGPAADTRQRVALVLRPRHHYSTLIYTGTNGGGCCDHGRRRGAMRRRAASPPAPQPCIGGEMCPCSNGGAAAESLALCGTWRFSQGSAARARSSPAPASPQPAAPGWTASVSWS